MAQMWCRLPDYSRVSGTGVVVVAVAEKEVGVVSVAASHSRSHSHYWCFQDSKLDSVFFPRFVCSCFLLVCPIYCTRYRRIGFQNRHRPHKAGRRNNVSCHDDNSRRRSGSLLLFGSQWKKSPWPVDHRGSHSAAQTCSCFLLLRLTRTRFKLATEGVCWMLKCQFIKARGTLVRQTIGVV